MNTKSLLMKLSKRFPKRIAKKYNDFVGLMCGNLKNDTKRIVLCLDLDNEILSDVVAFEPDLVITHHPFIYGRKSVVLKRDCLKLEMFNFLEKNDIPVYSFHTNFDEGVGGMNDALASKIGLKNIKPLTNNPMGRCGYLETEMKIEDLSIFLMEKLGVNYSHIINSGKKFIKNIAIIGGGGWYCFKDAMDDDIDCYVSGDIPHHGRRDVVLNKYNYIDMPHEIENIFMEQMKKILLDMDKDLEIITIRHEKNPKAIVL